jgi:hypothetical protein
VGASPGRLALVVGTVVAVSLVAGLAVYAGLPGSGAGSRTSSTPSASSSVAETMVTPSQNASSLDANSSSVAYPFANPGYITQSGGCSASYRSNGTAYAEPCSFGGTIQEALVFNCLAAAALPSGCAAQIAPLPGEVMQTPPVGNNTGPGVNSPVLNNTVTVWYPYVGTAANEPPWANCGYAAAHGPSTTTQFAFCVPLNSTSFIVSGPVPVLPIEGP